MPQQECPNKARSARGSERSEGSPSYTYAILIKPTAKFISREIDLKNVRSKLTQLKEVLTISDVRFEKGKHRNHIHAVVTSSRKGLYAKKYQSKGFYVGLQPVRSMSAYRTYINKEQEQIKIEDYFANNYAFSPL